MLSVVAAIAAPAATPETTRTESTLSTLQLRVLDELNVIRSAHGLASLHVSRPLAVAAAQHTREMAADGYFSHDSRNGTAFWRRIAQWYRSSGFSYWSVGENLLWATPDVSPARAVDMWMHSPEHRSNILNPAWREIGVAALHVSRAPGKYSGRPVTVLTTDFGIRRAGR